MAITNLQIKIEESFRAQNIVFNVFIQKNTGIVQANFIFSYLTEACSLKDVLHLGASKVKIS